MAAVHFVATPKRGFHMLEPKYARWLWEHLRRAFPRALACCLMPDHLHLLLPAGADENRLRCILAQHGRPAEASRGARSSSCVNLEVRGNRELGLCEP